MTPTLACSAAPFGYGPASKLVAIAERAREMDFRPVFVGTGAGFELAARSAAFEEVVLAPPGDRRARTLIASADAFVSSMDRKYLAFASERSLPVFVADSLFWMRHSIPAAFSSARRYWVQNFPGVPERAAETTPAPAVVGPIVRPGAERNRSPSKLVVSFGSADYPFEYLPADGSVFDFIVDGILASDLLDAFPDAVFLAGGRCIDHLSARYQQSKLDFVSASSDEARRLLASAALVLAAPGLTTALECFQGGIPVYFLPPLNYSQWWILKTFRHHGLAPGAFHWEDVFRDSPLAERMTEELRVTRFRNVIARVIREEAAAAALRDGFQAHARHASDDLGQRQRAFFDRLGPNGLDRIAADLADLC